jgi:hypothetical protein
MTLSFHHVACHTTKCVVIIIRNCIFGVCLEFIIVGEFLSYTRPFKSHDNSVGIALGYRLDDRSSRVRVPVGDGNFSLHHRVQNGSGAHPASYTMATTGYFPGDKAAGS